MGGRLGRRWGKRGRLGLAALMAGAVVAVLGAGPAAACGGLVGPGGTVKLARTTTMAAWHAGVEHYVTSFEYAGGGAEFGSITPLPGIPTKVEKGGEWTLQRLVNEVQPPSFFAEDAAGAAVRASAPQAEELLKAKVDALDVTILRGGGTAVGDWARKHGFGLSPDAPEVLDFYADRSPIFMAAAFNPERAGARGQQVGQGTPVHLTIPTANPWVPLRILSLGLKAGDTVQADVFLLTDRAPAMLPVPTLGEPGTSLAFSGEASRQLLADLRSDKGMGWMPDDDMWLSYLKVDTPAGKLRTDLALDVSGRNAPSAVAAGLALPGGAQPFTGGGSGSGTPWAQLAVAGIGLAMLTAAGVASRRRMRARDR
jgi:hypothetical protein